jgi:hypothetical protein
MHLPVQWHLHLIFWSLPQQLFFNYYCILGEDSCALLSLVQYMTNCASAVAGIVNFLIYKNMVLLHRSTPNQHLQFCIIQVIIIVGIMKHLNSSLPSEINKDSNPSKKRRSKFYSNDALQLDKLARLSRNPFLRHQKNDNFCLVTVSLNLSRHACMHAFPFPPRDFVHSCIHVAHRPRLISSDFSFPQIQEARIGSSSSRCIFFPISAALSLSLSSPLL